ncbi:YjbF family lipoprotein [Marinomonas sp. GJ51-6]|uniref:YjbF family lipoprotein n=1 Tax=Marinomonas sp. GJ51-6 TaxID=2992802 RepID=UPI002934B914|nr:YjbF family lipoprotein [Marinomonas sp. GJ51-6]WOD06140.1 YjbF family lipoprotein [Marinomonas sp. GJ51-6]
MSSFQVSVSKCFILLSILLMVGCTSNFQTAIESAKLAIEHNKGAKITKEHIETTPYSSAVVTVNNAPPILMILAFAEKNNYDGNYRLTWIASDKGTIVTENGRIIHTTGLNPSNLESLDGIEHDLPWVGQKEQWSAIYDWSPGYRYNFLATIETKFLGAQTITTDLWENKTNHWSESVYFEGFDHTFTNFFGASRLTIVLNRELLKVSNILVLIWTKLKC